MSNQSSVVDHYVILIGIDSYPERPLKGCTRDVQEIKEYLDRTIKSINIETFIASEHTSSEASDQRDDSDSRPTYENVTSAFRNINSVAKAGDFVYIHFSGHGTKTMPKHDDEYSNKGTGDLALVLLNKRDNRSVSYLTGPKLARYYLNPMVRKGLVVTLVLDCCFSASVYRRDGADIRFLPYNLRNDHSEQCDAEIQGDLDPGSIRDMRNASMQQNWLMDPDGYAILTACGPNQEGGEILLESGASYGKLSYFLRQSLGISGGCSNTHATIYRYLCAILQSHAVRQNPVLYGNKDQGFFGKARFESYYPLQVIRNLDGEFRLLAGQAHGFSHGDRFALYPFTNDAQVKSMLSMLAAEITHLGGLTSILKAQGMRIDRDEKMWTANVLTRSRLLDCLIWLPPISQRRINGRKL